jgi:hypothetical protein
LSAHLYNTADDYARFVESGVPALAALHAARSADPDAAFAGVAARVVPDASPLAV